MNLLFTSAMTQSPNIKSLVSKNLWTSYKLKPFKSDRYRPSSYSKHNRNTSNRIERIIKLKNKSTQSLRNSLRNFLRSRKISRNKSIHNESIFKMTTKTSYFTMKTSLNPPPASNTTKAQEDCSRMYWKARMMKIQMNTMTKSITFRKQLPQAKYQRKAIL